MMDVVQTIGGSLSNASIGGSLGDAARIAGEPFAPNGIGELIPDASLTKEGRAADAKAVGERLEAIGERVEHLETEVGDASILLSLI